MPAPTPDADADVVVVGAGIVGLATARALLASRPGLSVLVLDKEHHVATHQTGRNSGVVHSGIYYRPGSLKARLVATGRRELLDLARERGLHVDVCGKVVVAADDAEAARLVDLRERAAANAVPTTALDPAGIAAIEPHVRGVAGMHVPTAAIVDFGEVARTLAADLAPRGTLELGREVATVRTGGAGVVVEGPGGRWTARAAINCAGLHADVLARASGLDTPIRIIPFRGEYHELVPSRRHLVRHLVYPVPDPRLPFLGVHLTRMVDGSVHAGPNAVLATAREGYRRSQVDPAEVRALLGSPALRHLAARHWRTGVGEVVRSASVHATVRALRRLVPELRAADLVRAGTGVRAQACAPDGTLLDDFVVERSGRVVHVLNAPSPAATASLAIGRHIAGLVDDLL